MNYVVVLTPEAESDLARLETFLLEHDLTAAQRAATAIVARVFQGREDRPLA